jgi:hypothetical protein
VLWAKLTVLSAEEKAGKTGQVRIMELNESEEPIKRRQPKVWVKTREIACFWGRVWRIPDYRPDDRRRRGYRTMV